MKLLLPILVICAVLAFANAELEEFSENAPAPYGPEAVEERACGENAAANGSARATTPEFSRRHATADIKIKNLKPLMGDKDMEQKILCIKFLVTKRL
uniref:U34-Deinotoxin-Dsu1ar_1 n=1 Tax=Deinopis subrufa TaxID=1905329 RepID=A0A4Q8K999_DEISU